MIAQGFEFKGRKGQWQLHFELREDVLFLEAHSQETMETYEAQMTAQRIQQDKNLSFFFEAPKDLFKFLETSYNDIDILPDGTLLFAMDMPVGRAVKKIQFKIATVRREMDHSLMVDRKLKSLEKSVESLRQQNQQLMQKVDANSETTTTLREEVAALQRGLAQKDEVLNSIFSELAQLSRWREQKEQKLEGKEQKLEGKEQRLEGALQGRRRFVADELNSHSVKFTNVGTRYKKNVGGSWDLLICKHQIQKNEIARYTLRQIRAGNNGSFMYGIATAAARGVTRAQDHKEFIGYYENTGNIYDRGESKRGGAKIKDGDTVAIEIDTKSWKISWVVEGSREAECAITSQLKNKPIYLAIVMYNEDSEVQFL